jgi:hypothetical protein
MQKTNLVALSILATVLLSSALFSVATAQEADSIEPATTDPFMPSEPLVDPDAEAKAVDGQMAPRDSEVTDPDAPVSSDDAILYTIQGNETDSTDSDAEDANLISTQATSDYTLPIAAIGIAIPVIVGAAIGLVIYHRKQAVKT